MQVIDRPLPGLTGKQYLRCAALYGANGSGKSNVLRALACMQSIVMCSGSSIESQLLPHEPFSLDVTAKSQPTTFFTTFVWGGTRYEYSFGYLADRIISERLEAFPVGHARLMFERATLDNGAVHITVGSSMHMSATVKTLINKNMLVLSFLYAHPNAKGYAEVTPVGDFFERGLITRTNPRGRWAHFPTSAQVLDGTRGTDYQRAAIRKMMRDADAGITDTSIIERELPQTEQPADVLSDSPTENEQTDAQPHKVKVIVFDHGTPDKGCTIPLSEESLGTSQLFSLSAHIARALETDATLVVDELDASMHPKLCYEIVRLFERDTTGSHSAQLIFTAHQTHLMEGDLLDRDQIWFTEKISDGSTELTPLSDFSPRKKERLEASYLIGRYAGVPILTRDFGLLPGEETDNGQ